MLLFSNHVKNPPQILVIEKANLGHEETFAADVHAHCHDCGDGFLGISIGQNLSDYIP